MNFEKKKEYFHVLAEVLNSDNHPYTNDFLEIQLLIKFQW